MRYSSLLLAGLCLGATLALAQAPTAPAGAAATEGPGEVVQNAAQGMLHDLDQDRDSYRRDPQKVGALVDKYLLPHFDTEYSARLVLGQYWRTANQEQRKRFMDAFYHSLLTTYSSALVALTPDRLKVFPTTVDPNADHATVRTEVTGDNADRIEMNYSMHK